MTEIRPIRQGEAEDFLQTLCDVFGLDFGRAYNVFFEEPFFDLNRKWALFEGGQMVSVLTTTPLRFGWGRAVGVAGVATRPERRNEGHARLLLERVMREAERAGEGSALLFAQRSELYEAAGFEPLDRVIRAPLTGFDLEPEVSALGPERVRAIYDQWSEGDAERLRRDDQRWRYWRWSYRACEPVGEGYVCVEPGLLREGLFHRSTRRLPLTPDTQWYGTTRTADVLGLQFEQAAVELYLMGRNFPGVPQLFMTDQF